MLVGGSRAQGKGRNVEKNNLKIGKGLNTRSDIDFIYDKNHPNIEKLYQRLMMVGNKAGQTHPDIDNIWRDPTWPETNGIWRFQFRPNQEPKIINLFE